MCCPLCWRAGLPELKCLWEREQEPSVSVLFFIPKDEHTVTPTPSLPSCHLSSGCFHQYQLMFCKLTQTQSLQPLVYMAAPGRGSR